MSTVELPKYQIGDIVLVIAEYGTIVDVLENDHYDVKMAKRGSVCLLHANHFQLALTEAQAAALSALCERYGALFRPEDFTPVFDLPEGWVGGWVGTSIEVGCSPEGKIDS